MFGIIQAFLQPAILQLFFICALYIGFEVWLLHTLQLWDSGQIKTTLLWAASVAIVSIGRALNTKDGAHLIRHLVTDNLKFIVIIEFIIGFYPLSLTVELILIPFVTFAAVSIAFAEGMENMAQVKKLFEWILLAVGIILLLRALNQLLSHFNDFAQVTTLVDFSLPPFLSLFYLPFLYALYLLSNYQTAFHMMDHHVPDKSVLQYAKHRAAFAFHFKIQRLKEWARFLVWTDNLSIKDINQSILNYKLLYRRSLNPEKVKIEDGWSPFTAMHFLTEEKLTTTLYHPTSGNEWWASSENIKFNSMLLNTVTFFISGTEEVVTKLKLSFDISNVKNEEKTIERVNQIMKSLFKASRVTLSNQLNKSLEIKEGSIINFDQAIVKIRREAFDELNNYYIYFEIVHKNHNPEF